MSRYLIVGAGRSGINAAQLLIKVGEDFIIYDGNENFDTAAACEKIGRDNIEFILGDFSGFDFSRVDICVVSPGVSLETPSKNMIYRSGARSSLPTGTTRARLSA